MMISTKCSKTFYTHLKCNYFQNRNRRSAFLFRTFGSRKAGLIGNVFFKPFDTVVWIVLAVCIVVLAAGTHLIVRNEARNRKMGLKFAQSWVLTILNILGIFCQQGLTIYEQQGKAFVEFKHVYIGASVVPRSMNGRGLFIAASLASLIVYSYYTTEVMSALISSPVTTDINTITQLADSHLEVRIEKAVYMRTFLNVY